MIPTKLLIPEVESRTDASAFFFFLRKKWVFKSTQRFVDNTCIAMALPPIRPVPMGMKGRFPRSRGELGMTPHSVEEDNR